MVVMDLNPYQSPIETGLTQSGNYRQLCGWCAWAMFAAAVIANLAVRIAHLRD